jgi:serine/threonine protein kinase
MLRSLRHPCVLDILGVSPPVGFSSPKIATAYMTNRSLQEALQKRESRQVPPFLNETGIAIIVSGLVLGTRFLHSRGAVHRDLKSENLFLDIDGPLTIGDLGTCRFVSHDGTMTFDVGSYCYMAPEIALGLEYTNAVDVYSFGLILFEVSLDVWFGARKCLCTGSLNRPRGYSGPNCLMA